MIMRRFRSLLLALLLPALALSCRDATGPGEVRIYTIPGHLAIANDGEAPLYSAAFDEELLPLLDWIPGVCEECGKVEAGATRHFDDDSIAAPGRAVIVFYWRAVVGVGHQVSAGPVSHRRIRLDPGLID